MKGNDMEFKELFYLVSAIIMLAALLWDSLEDRRSV